MNPSNLNLNNKHDAISFLSHKKAYEEVVKYVENKSVIEIGCGAGHGSKFLSQYAKNIFTVDLDKNSLDHAKKSNYAANIEYVNANVLEGLPFDDNKFDVAICFQVFEHIHKKNSLRFITEIKRVLKPGSILILTTPNRKIRLQPFQKPTNKYHKIEYTNKTLQKGLLKVFNSVDIVGLRATKEIELEIIKGKQTVFQAYIRNPLRKAIFTFASILGIKTIVNTLKKRTQKGIVKKSDSSEEFNYTTNDFYFDSKNINNSIDLMALCKTS